MRANVVPAGPLSRWAGTKCHHCGRMARAGQVVLWAKIPTVEWGSDLFVVHVGCMAQLVRSAPSNRPTPETTRAERRNASRRRRAAARRRAVEALCQEHADRLAELVELEIVIDRLAGD